MDSLFQLVREQQGISQGKHFNDLANDNAINFCKYLSVNDIVNLSSVNKRWHEVILGATLTAADRIWEQLSFNDFNLPTHFKPFNRLSWNGFYKIRALAERNLVQARYSMTAMISIRAVYVNERKNGAANILTFTLPEETESQILFLSPRDDTTVLVWSPAQQTPTSIHTGNGKVSLHQVVNQLTFSQQGPYLLLSDFMNQEKQNEIVLYDLAKRSIACSFIVPSNSSILSAQIFMQDNVPYIFLYGPWHQHPEVWNIASGTLVHKFDKMHYFNGPLLLTLNSGKECFVHHDGNEWLVVDVMNKEVVKKLHYQSSSRRVGFATPEQTQIPHVLHKDGRQYLAVTLPQYCETVIWDTESWEVASVISHQNGWTDVGFVAHKNSSYFLTRGRAITAEDNYAGSGIVRKYDVYMDRWDFSASMEQVTHTWNCSWQCDNDPQLAEHNGERGRVGPSTQTSLIITLQGKKRLLINEDRMLFLMDLETKRCLAKFPWPRDVLDIRSIEIEGIPHLLVIEKFGMYLWDFNDRPPASSAMAMEGVSNPSLPASDTSGWISRRKIRQLRKNGLKNLVLICLLALGCYLMRGVASRAYSAARGLF